MVKKITKNFMGMKIFDEKILKNKKKIDKKNCLSKIWAKNVWAKNFLVKFFLAQLGLTGGQGVRFFRKLVSQFFFV